ncbi:MAG TPA: glutamate formimidoyltransferase [Bryobacteraceae bacterium]|nr:glutamate formimidoyltransferase [Bryobacteraceae bacterium]
MIGRAVIECVPNFSEGRDAAKVRAIVAAIESARGVLLAGYESDQDHNRSVVTFAGEPEAVLEGAIRGAGKAAELIDLNAHRGVHPRVGAADVIPFVPMEAATLADCIAIAHRAGEEIWRRFGVPVYFYEAAARTLERKRLERVRRRGFDGKPPDIGTIPAHATAGAAVVGARDFLIAYNINLATPDPAIAQAIARKIRESSGGFPFVKAMGRYLASRNCAQISMNLTNFAQTPLDLVYKAIADEAGRNATSIASGQIVGFIPRRAFEMFPEFFRRAENFDESRVIETRIARMKESAGQH